MNKLIFGKDSTEGITNVSYKDGKMYLYRNSELLKTINYIPYALTSRKGVGSVRLKGNGFYKYITPIRKTPYDKVYGYGIYKPRSIEEGYMLWSGVTCYKGMKINEVSVLSFDIEATGVNPDDPNAEVILISNTFRNSSGKIEKKLFDIKDYCNQKQMIKDWSKWVIKIDPDILMGHNIFSYDIPYIAKCYGEDLKLGRDESPITFNKSIKIQHAGLDYSVPTCSIHGRDIIDTWILSMKYDALNEFPSYGLKAVEKHLDIVGSDRIDWDFEKFPTRKYKQWDSKTWESFKQYCRDDGDSPITMFDIMAPSFFYLTASVPKSFQDVINQRSGSQIDSMMIRSYLQDGYSQPRSNKKSPYKGAISMGIPGVYKNVRKFDVASLYPSIILEKEIYSKSKDPNKHMLKILDYFRNERLANKKLASEGSKYHDDLQSAQKIVINSMYGFLGTDYLLYNDMAGADAVTARGREIVQMAIEWACGFRLKEDIKKIVNEGKPNEKIHYHWVPGDKISEGLGFELVNTDTDSISITNGKPPTKDEFKEQIKSLNSIYPDLISWEDDGVFENFVVVSAKNYVTQLHKDWCKQKDIDPKTNRGKVKFKGGSIKDSKKEPKLRNLLDKILTSFIDKEIENPEDYILSEYNKLCCEILGLNKIDGWLMKKSASKAILASENDPKARANEKQPLNAINEAIEKGIIENIQEGDKFWVYRAVFGEKQEIKKGEPQFYKKTGKPKMVKDAGYRFPQLYNNDHDVDYYLNRIYDTVMIISNLIDKNKFLNYSKNRNKPVILGIYEQST